MARKTKTKKTVTRTTAVAKTVPLAQFEKVQAEGVAAFNQLKKLEKMNAGLKVDLKTMAKKFGVEFGKVRAANINLSRKLNIIQEVVQPAVEFSEDNLHVAVLAGEELEAAKARAAQNGEQLSGH